MQLRPKAAWSGRRTMGKVSRMEEEPRTVHPIQARCEVYPRVCGRTLPMMTERFYLKFCD